MAKKSSSPKRNVGSDRGRVSSQKHEISYSGKKVAGKGGAKKVLAAKKALGRTTSRAAVMKKAKSL